MFKYPQHMAWETRGEVEPTDLKLSTGEVEIHPDSHLPGSVELLSES